MALGAAAPEPVARLLWLASDAVRALAELTGAGSGLVAGFTRFMSGVPELELSSSSASRGRFVGSLVGFAITWARMVSLSFSRFSSRGGAFVFATGFGFGAMVSFSAALGFSTSRWVGLEAGATAAFGFPMDVERGTSSSLELESETNSLDKTRAPLGPAALAGGLAADGFGAAFGVVAAAGFFFVVESSRLACASDAESFFFPVEV